MSQDPDALPPVTEHSARLLIPALQILRPDLAQYAGAARHDDFALAVCQAWQLDRDASADDLRARARATVYGGCR